MAPLSTATGSDTASAARSEQAREQRVDVVAGHAHVREADVRRAQRRMPAARRAELEQLDARALAGERELRRAHVHPVLAHDRLEVAALPVLLHDDLHAERVAPERQCALEARDRQAGVMDLCHGHWIVNPPSTTSVWPVISTCN